MKINYLLSRLTREKYINRWVILLIDLFLSVFSTVTSLALISYILDCDYSNQTSIQRIPGIGLLQPCQFFYMPDL